MNKRGYKFYSVKFCIVLMGLSALPGVVSSQENSAELLVSEAQDSPLQADTLLRAEDRAQGVSEPSIADRKSVV